MSYIYNLADTWDNAGTVFTAIKMDVTDVASNASSALLDLQVGGVSQFKVSKAGAVTAVGVAIPTISSSDTLSNKTLSSPVLSGTVAGSATWSAEQRISGPYIGGSTSSYRGLSDTSGVYASAGAILVWGGSGDEHTYLSARTGSNVFIRANGLAGTSLIIANSALTWGGVAIPTISSTDTLTNKTLSSPTLSGTVAGLPALTGQWQWSGGNDAAYWHAIVLSPTDAGNNKPSLYITHTSPSAYAIGLFDGTDTDGTIAFNCGVLNHNGVAIPTISSTDTLTNKTLSSPTLSGTVAGSVSFSGTSNFGGVHIINGTGTNSFKITDSSVGTVLAFTPVEPAGVRRVQFLFSPDGSAPTSLGFFDQTGIELASGKGFKVNSVAVPTISSTDTLSNKTLSSPTLSGTVAGTPTFSGSPIKIGDGTDTVAMTGTSPQLRVQGASFSTGIIARRDGNAEVGIQSTGTGNIGTWTNHAVQLYVNAANRIEFGTGSATFTDGYNLVFSTTTGTKIGTGTSQKLGFFNATPVVQPTAVADATDAASVITQLNALLSRMRDLGLIAT